MQSESMEIDEEAEDEAEVTCAARRAVVELLAQRIKVTRKFSSASAVLDPDSLQSGYIGQEMERN